MPTVITTRDLRNILYQVEHQEMTVRELRQALFDQKDQELAIGLAIQDINAGRTRRPQKGTDDAKNHEQGR